MVAMAPSKMNQSIKAWLPPAIVSLFRRRGDSSIFEGDYASWQEALAHSTGYDADEIFRNVREAALKVKQGDAVFERDGVCFFHEEYNWEVLACLLLSAAEREGVLNVLDFGGALGNFYFQHRKFFSGLKEQRWGIVEQKHFVECGRSEFENEKLRFYFSANECFEKMPVNLILLSSVLPYLEHPYDVLTDLGQRKADYIVIDRTPFIDQKEDRLMIQHVPKRIFPASLQMWVFSEQKFESAMNRLGYSQTARFPCAEGNVGEIGFNGFIYRREEP